MAAVSSEYRKINKSLAQREVNGGKSAAALFLTMHTAECFELPPAMRGLHWRLLLLHSNHSNFFQLFHQLSSVSVFPSAAWAAWRPASSAAEQRPRREGYFSDGARFYPRAKLTEPSPKKEALATRGGSCENKRRTTVQNRAEIETKRGIIIIVVWALAQT